MNDSPFYARTRFILILLIIVAVYVYGWKSTGMDPGALFRDAHLVQPLLRDLLRPDIIAPDTESQMLEAEFELDASVSTLAGEETPGEAKAGLRLSARRGRIGDSLEVEGTSLRPDTGVELLWVNSIEQEFPLGQFKTDAGGSFRAEIRVPETARGDRQYVRAVLTWPTGGTHISRTFELTMEKIVETLFLALMSTTLAVLAAVPLSFLGARNLMCRHPAGTGVYYLVRAFFNILRSIEPLILAILFAVWVGIGPFAGVLALALHSVAALGKMYSEQIESIDPGPVEAITATGAPPLLVALYAVVPQVVPPFLAFTFYRWDINVRMSTIIGFVGGGGIGFLLQQWINLLQYREAGTALLAIAVVVIVLDLLSARIREKIV